MIDCTVSSFRFCHLINLILYHVKFQVPKSLAVVYGLSVTQEKHRFGLLVKTKNTLHDMK
jgi:hypothetical protein